MSERRSFQPPPPSRPALPEGAHRAVLRLSLAAVGLQQLLRLEGLRTVRAAGAEVAGEWDATVVAVGAPTLAFALLVPALLVLSAFSSQLSLLERRRGRLVWTLVALATATWLGLALTTGRKAQALAVRVPFVLGLAVVAALFAALAARDVRRALASRPWLAVLLGVVVSGAALVVDARVLPRLYPVFHGGLVVVGLAGLLVVADGVVGAVSALGRRARVVLDLAAAAGLLWCALGLRYVPRAGEELARFDNARRILDERSLHLGRVAALAVKRWPPRVVDDEAAPDPLAVPKGPRALAAEGRDLLLVTVDALRADHLGCYGYPRKTTPTLDALAREGVLFERAYTPTPHTSYAIGSLMTGKYLRPVLTLAAATGGVRRPDETWAGLLRTYGFRTAAFYPPAVFHVDADRFADLQQRGLDFEYAKVEFAAPSLRAAQLTSYLAAAPKDKPLFVWVHLFEPHEPYVAHPEHPFGETDVDRYDSEIAAADAGLAKMVAAFRAARPGGVVIVSADHGEAFGEHGARYHGTTVYEEQVRVPLLVSAPGLVATGRRVAEPVQLVDLLPTVLSAYGIPRPPRVRGRDLGALLAVGAPKGGGAGEGLAFAEVEDQTMFARGSHRLLCNRVLATCSLYDLAKDPLELSPIADAARVTELRKQTSGLLAASAALEGLGGTGWPEPLRRALSGDADAAIDVTPLLDDVDVAFRRRAAEALARLARAETSPHVVRALGLEKDEVARGWLVVAAVRTDPKSPEAARLSALVARDDRIGRFAALAASEAATTPFGVMPQAFDRLLSLLEEVRGDAVLSRASLQGLARLGRGQPVLGRKATPAIVAALDDVRLRAVAAEALGLLADTAAAPALLGRLAEERHVDARMPLAMALARLGAGDAALPHVVRFLGVPELPPGGGDALAALLAGRTLPWLGRPPEPVVQGKVLLHVAKAGPFRLLVLGVPLGTGVEITVDGAKVPVASTAAGPVVEVASHAPGPLTVQWMSSAKVRGVALIPRTQDLPPPKADAEAP